jgi:hypothetical protein
MSLDDELSVLEMVENIVGSNTIPQSAETKARLFTLIPPSGATALLSKPETIDLCSEII